MTIRIVARTEYTDGTCSYEMRVGRHRVYVLADGTVAGWDPLTSDYSRTVLVPTRIVAQARRALAASQ